MVSPFAIRLALPSVENAGAVSGRLYGLSTIGSILGTFGAAILFIPAVGTQRTMIGTAVALALAGGLLLGARWQVLTIAFAALLAVPPGAVKSASGVIYERESRYQYVDVRRALGRRARARAQRGRRRRTPCGIRTASSPAGSGTCSSSCRRSSRIR